MAFDSRPIIDRRVMRLERRIARQQRRMMRHQLRYQRHQMRMLKYQQRLQRALGRGTMAPGVMSRSLGPDGMLGPRGMFGSGGMFGPAGMFSHRGVFGHHRPFGHRGIFAARQSGLWRRRSRRLFPVLLGLLLVGIATAMMAAKGERPSGNWVSV